MQAGYNHACYQTPEMQSRSVVAARLHFDTPKPFKHVEQFAAGAATVSERLAKSKLLKCDLVVLAAGSKADIHQPSKPVANAWLSSC